MTVQLHSRFSEVASRLPEKPKRQQRSKSPRPISIRVTAKERAQLEMEAGERTLSAYVRSRLFGSKGKRGPDRRASVDAAALARLLASLGRSDLASSMRTLAQAAKTGTLDSGPDLLKRLEHACGEISEIRRDLILALGIKPE